MCMGVCVCFCCGLLSRCNLSFWRGKFCCSFAAFLWLYSVHSYVCHPLPPLNIVLLSRPDYGLNVLLFMRFSRSPPKNIFSWHAKSFCLNEVLILGEFLAKIMEGRGEMFVCWFEASTVKCGKAITWKCIYYFCKLLLFLRVNCLCESCIKIASFRSRSSFFLVISLFAFYFVCVFSVLAINFL